MGKPPHPSGSPFPEGRGVSQRALNNHHEKSEDRSSESDEKGVQFTGKSQNDCELFASVRRRVYKTICGSKNQGSGEG